jgi:cell division septum initiation protein DivIVA
MAQNAVLNDITEGKVNVCAQVAMIALKLEWLANAMKASDDSPASEILEDITAQLDALVEPIAELQGVHHG